MALGKAGILWLPVAKVHAMLIYEVCFWRRHWCHHPKFSPALTKVSCAPVNECMYIHGTLTRYVKLRVVHASRIPELFLRHRLQREPLVNDPGMHHDTCVSHVPWCMLGSLTRSGGENVPDIPGAGATHNFMYLARGPCIHTNGAGWTST